MPLAPSPPAPAFALTPTAAGSPVTAVERCETEKEWDPMGLQTSRIWLIHTL